MSPSVWGIEEIILRKYRMLMLIYPLSRLRKCRYQLWLVASAGRMSVKPVCM